MQCTTLSRLRTFSTIVLAHELGCTFCMSEQTTINHKDLLNIHVELAEL
jgi:hypothetical protein